MKSVRFTRREFIRKAGSTGAAIGAGLVLPGAAGRVFADPAAPAAVPAGPADIAVVQGPAIEAVDRALELIGGLSRFVKKGDRVVLKPNIGFPTTPEVGATTSPEVVQRVAALCHLAGAKQILVLDNPVRRPDVCLKRSGIKSACQGVPQTTVSAQRDRVFFQAVAMPLEGKEHTIEVLKDVLAADVLINIPTAKSHSMTGVSLGIKNLMGVIRDRGYFHREVDLDRAVAALSVVVRPQLTLIDASRALIDSGPGGPGTIAHLKTIVAGTDPVAVDALGVGLTPWYGKDFTARQTKHILYAHELGIGEIDFGKLRVERAVVS